MARAAPRPSLTQSPDRGTVLTRATLRAADCLGVSARGLSAVLGLSEPSVSRMKTGGYVLEEGSKSYELAALFIRLFRALDAIAGGDERVARAWMVAENHALGGRPADRIGTIAGLMDVTAYLDARRARV